MKAWGRPARSRHDGPSTPRDLTEIAETPEEGKTSKRGKSHAHTMNPSDDTTHDPGLNLLRGGRSPVRTAVPIRNHVPGNLQERTGMSVKPSPDPQGKRDLTRLPPAGSMKNSTRRL